MENSIRPAVREDAEALAELVNSAYRGESSKKGWTTEADLLAGKRADRELIEGLVGDPASVVLLCVEDGRMVGCVHLKKREGSAYLGLLTVRPDLQASGLGRRLLAAAEEWTVQRFGLGVIEMTVIRRRTELIAWYVRRGYADTGRRQPFPPEERLAVPKVEDLEMVVLAKTLGRENGK